MGERKANQKIEKTSENQLSEVFSMDFISLEDSIDKLFSVSKNLNKKVLVPLYKNYTKVNSISEDFLAFSDYKEQFKSFLQKSLTSQKLNPDNIQTVGYKNGNILLDFGGEIGVQKIAFSDFQKELAFGNAKTDVKQVEQTIKTLQFAMNYIYSKNSSYFSSIDDTDVVNIPKLIKTLKKSQKNADLRAKGYYNAGASVAGFETFAEMNYAELQQIFAPYSGMHLGELREQLELTQNKLVLYYDIIGKTKKSLKLLEEEILYMGAIGRDKKKGERIIFEGERKESLNTKETEETRKKVQDLVQEYFQYKQRKIFSKKEEIIVNIGEILELRKLDEKSKNKTSMRYNGYTYEKFSYQPTLPSLSYFETYSYAELRKLLQPYRGKTIQQVASIKNNPQQGIEKAGKGPKKQSEEKAKISPSNEVLEKVEQIIKRKSVPELIDYIRVINNKISDSGKLPDMTKNINLMIVKKLTADTFKKMKREKIPTRDFINFARVITGRPLTDEIGKEKKYETSEYSNGLHGRPKGTHRVYHEENRVEVKADFQQTELARKVLLYVMYQRGGLEQMQNSKDEDGNTQKVQVEDPIYTEKKYTDSKGYRGYSDHSYTYQLEITEEKTKSIEVILDKSLVVFEELGLNKWEMLAKMGLNDLLCKQDISALNFQELLLLGTLYRISKNIKKQFETLKGKTPDQVEQILAQANNEALEETFSVLNDSFEKNFDASFWNGNWNGKNGDEFSELSAENREAFDLYGEINGRGYFELADDNWLAQNLLTKEMGVVLVVGVLTAYLVLPGCIMASGGWATVIAGAKIGATTSIASQIMSDKGYDTFEEEIVGRLSQFGIDVASSAVFTWISAGLIGKCMGNKFSATLKQELETGTLSPKTISKLTSIEEDITKEVARNYGALGKLGRTPEGLWKNSAQTVKTELRALREAGFSGQRLSADIINYVKRFSATNGGVGQITDIGIGLGDGVNASILQQYLEYQVIDEVFAKNHFDSETESFLEKKYGKQAVKKIQAQEKAIQQEAQKQAQQLTLESEKVLQIFKETAKKNPVMFREWEKCSEQEKRDVALLLVASKGREVWITASKEERDATGEMFALLFKQNEGIE